jgi:nitrite reductase/ring-hydroxylating ferredoxin subunit
MVERNDGRVGGGLAERPLAEGELSLSGVPPADAAPSGRFSRRRVLKWVIRVGYLAFAAAFAVPATALRSLSQRQEGIAQGDLLVYAPTTSGAAIGSPVLAADLAVGTGVQVFPEGKQDDQNNLIEVVRVAEGSGAEGLVAYSAICTHLGCAVYAQLNDAGQIACPCHASLFDPDADAAPARCRRCRSTSTPRGP